MKTLIEAAKVLGLDPGTLRVQIHNGKLRAKKVGRDWTVSEHEVERYARDREVQRRARDDRRRKYLHESA